MMIKETKKSPTIRFRRFIDDWEQRSFGDIFEERSEKNHAKLPPLTIMQGVGTVRRDETDRELIYDKNSLINYKLVKRNDFIVHLRSFEGGLEKSNLDGIVSPAYHVFCGRKINPEFYYSFFRSDEFINHKLVPFVYGIRDGRSIDISGMKMIQIPYPSVDEQNCIGELIGKLNAAIALYQSKLEQQKKLKKYFLQNMFPAKGEKVPKIRLKGYTDEWKECKLKDIYGNIGNAFVGTATPYYTSNGHFYLESNNVKDGQINREIEVFINDEFYEKQKDKWLHTGDIVMVQSGHVGHTAVIPSELDKTAAHALIMFRQPKIKVDPYFLNYQFQTDKSRKSFNSITVGNTIEHILASSMKEYIVDMPSYIEQQSISHYFKEIDCLINFQQRKLGELQSLKKYMLQNMFI